eukprot:93173-Amphidinium_carterae.5
MGKAKHEEKASSSGHRSELPFQARERVPAGKNSDEKAKKSAGSRQGSVAESNTSGIQDRGRRPYPFRSSEASSGAKVLGKPPPRW